MRKKIQRIVGTLIMMLMVLALGGCGQSERAANTDSITVYFYNVQSGKVESHELAVTLPDNATSEHRMSAVIEGLYKGPKVSNQGHKAMDFYIKESNLKERIAYITFDEIYQTLPIDTQVSMRVALVYSLTALDFVEGVEFSVGDMPLTTNYGTKVGIVTRKDFLIDGLNPTPPTTSQTITLYFPKANDTKLYKEERTIHVSDNTPLEQYVMEELIKGPQIEGLLPVIRPEVKTNELTTQELVCYVDLPYNLNNPQLSVPIDEKLMIYAIVNSLTEIPQIQEVIFLMDGKKQAEFPTATDTGGLFERNEALIADPS